MKQILCLPVDSQTSLQIISRTSSLETIMCCDIIDCKLSSPKGVVEVFNNTRVCDLDVLKKNLELLMQGTKQSFCFQESLTLYGDLHENFVIQIDVNDHIYFKKSIDGSALQAWVAQLDLLHVLAEENEKEKASKGKGCC